MPPPSRAGWPRHDPGGGPPSRARPRSAAGPVGSAPPQRVSGQARLATPPSGNPRFSRQVAPSTCRAASASARRCSTVPLLPSSPRVRSHNPTRCPAWTCLGERAADADLDVVRMRPEGQQVDLHGVSGRLAHEAEQLVSFERFAQVMPQQHARRQESLAPGRCHRSRAQRDDAGSCGAAPRRAGRRPCRPRVRSRHTPAGCRR